MGGCQKVFVIDANIILSVLIKPSGVTARLFHELVKRGCELYTPSYLWREVTKHRDVVVRKNPLLKGIVSEAINILSGFIAVVPEKELKVKLPLAQDLVHDEKDALYVAAALFLRSKHNNVVILTFNVKDFKVKELEKIGIEVLKPSIDLLASS